jgi:hypothetical protein
MVQFLSIMRKNKNMKKLLLSGLLVIIITSVKSQETKTDVLQSLENNQSATQNTVVPAIIKSATRLFKDKEDLTSVILVVPKDSIVFVIGSDETFLHVDYEGNEGFIYARHAEIFKPDGEAQPQDVPVTANQEAKPVQEQMISRYSYLEKKYGPSLASRIYSGKIWKGMNIDLVRDSWGSPKKIDRVISSDVVNEEWFYNGTWLHFQNSTLTDWGPVK